MTAPWLLFLSVTLGLIAGGGTEAVQAPVRLWTASMAATDIIPAQVCALAVLQ
jgi:hypothetical protein